MFYLKIFSFSITDIWQGVIFIGREVSEVEIMMEITEAGIEISLFN